MCYLKENSITDINYYYILGYRNFVVAQQFCLLAYMVGLTD